MPLLWFFVTPWSRLSRTNQNSSFCWFSFWVSKTGRRYNVETTTVSLQGFRSLNSEHAIWNTNPSTNYSERNFMGAELYHVLRLECVRQHQEVGGVSSHDVVCTAYYWASTSSTY